MRNKILYSLLIVFTASVIITGISMYSKLYAPNVRLLGTNQEYFYIHTGWTIDDVYKSLCNKRLIKNIHSFEWLCEKKGYMTHVKAGKYLIRQGMSNTELVNMLRLGIQVPVKLAVHNQRTPAHLAGMVSRYIEADSAALMEILTNDSKLERYHVSKETVITLFVPDTYELFWNTNAEDFISRMYTEYTKFWNAERTQQAASIGLWPEEVYTLASIVDEESNMSAEFAVIAGVYMNRLHANMPLQADPTIKFALGDFSLKRILQKHLQIESPYNTYKHTGLPPGPIAMPSVKAIDAVLHYEHHKYLYFCAKADFSGYHAYAKTLSEHNQNAHDYWRELNKRKIY